MGLLIAGLIACAPRQAPPTRVADDSLPVSAPPSSPAPASPTMPTSERPSSESSASVIVPAGGEASVHGLVITAIEVREEQYDHQPDHGDALAATLHVRGAGTPAPSLSEMAAEPQALVRVSSGAEGSRWQRFQFVVTGGDRTALVLRVTPIPRAGSLGGTPLKLAAVEGAGSAAGLAVTVLEVIEKRTMDGGSMMRVRLHVRRAGTPAPAPAVMANQQESLVTLTSEPGGDIVTWNGFRIGYVGGWRTEVDLRILPPGSE